MNTASEKIFVSSKKTLAMAKKMEYVGFDGPNCAFLHVALGEASLTQSMILSKAD